jgi:hypothetical protein
MTDIPKGNADKNGVTIKNPGADVIRCQNHHEALIAPERFAKVQALIADRMPARKDEPHES